MNKNFISVIYAENFRFVNKFSIDRPLGSLDTPSYLFFYKNVNDSFSLIENAIFR